MRRAITLDTMLKPAPESVKKRYRLKVSRRNRYAKELARYQRLFAKAEREVNEYERRHGERLVLAS